MTTIDTVAIHDLRDLRCFVAGGAGFIGSSPGASAKAAAAVVPENWD
jgi:hypothetical protein